MNFEFLIPQIAKTLGMSPSTLVFYVVVIMTVCRGITRRIPDTATGWLAVVRRITGFISVEVASRIAPGITVQSIAKAALETPPIAKKVGDVIDTPHGITAGFVGSGTLATLNDGSSRKRGQEDA